MGTHPFIALTDLKWFEFLSGCANAGRLDEVNFWSPESTQPLKKLRPGEPIFFRLKRPDHKIAGYGFFAHFAALDLEEAWTTFRTNNGDPDRIRFLSRIGGYRGVDLLDPASERRSIGCTILRDAVFWPRERWIPWGEQEGWDPEIVRGKTETDAVRASRLLAEIQLDAIDEPEEFAPDFEPLEVDERELVRASTRARVGQGTFRTRLLTAYSRRCAITGERTEPVLAAAHIQPYLGPRSNHVRNGILLCQEFHTLFDLGYVGITPELAIRVSPRLRRDWDNGRRYYAYDGQRLASVPAMPEQLPSPAALGWHLERRFRD